MLSIPGVLLGLDRSGVEPGMVGQDPDQLRVQRRVSRLSCGRHSHQAQRFIGPPLHQAHDSEFGAQPCGGLGVSRCASSSADSASPIFLPGRDARPARSGRRSPDAASRPSAWPPRSRCPPVSGDGRVLFLDLGAGQNDTTRSKDRVRGEPSILPRHAQTDRARDPAAPKHRMAGQCLRQATTQRRQMRG